MIIDLNCPVEMFHYEIVYDDIGTSVATIDLQNIGGKTITTYSVTVHAENTKACESLDMNHIVDNVSLEDGVEFKLRMTIDLRFTDKLELFFSSVSFDDGTVWNAGRDCDLVDISVMKKLEGTLLDDLKDIAGEDASVYPEMQDNYWRCVCGRINSLDNAECIRCKRTRSYVLTELNSKILNLTKEQEKERKKRKKRAEKAHKRAQNEGSSYAYIVVLLAAIIAFLIIFYYVGFMKPSLLG